jgi:iron complex transport system substrate-binding protein
MKSAIITSFVAAALAMLVQGTATAAPTRIVSINMCADELLLALADPGQIVALSPYATDPTLSFMADQAAKFRHDAAEAETVVDLHPDLVLSGRFTKRATREMLTRLGYRLELLDAPRSIDQSIAQIRDVAAMVGHPERGAALIGKIAAARKAALAAAKGRPHPTAALYQRRGYVTGGDTLTAELLSIAGFAYDGGALAGKTGGFVPLEKLVVGRPDYIVVASADPHAVDQGTALLSHPALATLYPPSRRIVLPEKLTVCGGPSLPAALDWLTRAAGRPGRGP